MSQRQNAITTVLRVCISNSSEKVVVLLKSLYCIIIVSYYHGKNATFLLLSASDIFTIQRGCKIHTHKKIASVAATNVLDKCTCKLMSREGGEYALRTYVRATENGFTRCEAKLWKVVCIGYGNVQHDPFGLFDQFIICGVGTST